MTQHEALLSALRRGERLTVKIALDRYGVYALSQRIGELKKGHPIQSRMITTLTGKRVAEYWIEREQPEQLPLELAA